MHSKFVPIYLLMISYKREESAIAIINNYLKANKPNVKTRFILIENSPFQKLPSLFPNIQEMELVSYHYFQNSNKSKAVNYAINNYITESEALIVHIDNDINFDNDFLVNYHKTATEKGPLFYFGAGFRVPPPEIKDSRLMPFVQGSALGKTDTEFLKMKNPMFLGFNFCFFKSQWQKVKGLDERFGPGSKTNLSGDESVFQFKLKYVGYRPFFVENNYVLHQPEPVNYFKKNILKRVQNNGYTHGFQALIADKNYLKKIAYLMKRCLILLIKGSIFELQFKYSYLFGHLHAYWLYLWIDNKKSFYDGLDKDSVKID
jgi:hypothetical protein